MEIEFERSGNWVWMNGVGGMKGRNSATIIVGYFNIAFNEETQESVQNIPMDNPIYPLLRRHQYKTIQFLICDKLAIQSQVFLSHTNGKKDSANNCSMWEMIKIITIAMVTGSWFWIKIMIDVDPNYFFYYWCCFRFWFQISIL